jgi:truncated hemoglobin YjbI
MTGSDYDRLGGLAGVQKLIAAFVNREAEDFIVGYLFSGKDLEHIVARESTFAAQHLGGPVTYDGRRLDRVHRPLKINSGHFRRRLAILRTVLLEHSVAEDIIERWVAHDERLLGLITDGTDCL